MSEENKNEGAVFNLPLPYVYPEPSRNVLIQSKQSDAEAGVQRHLQFTHDGSLTVIEYCTEEVRRQGHDVTTAEGIERVGGMLLGWAYACEQNSKSFDGADIIRLGWQVERRKNRDGLRKCGVRVGDKAMPPHWEVEQRLKDLLTIQSTLTPLEFYRAFLEIHPFEDGNGRVGKILLNWKNGTLLSGPIFPPNDFWGDWIVNP